MISACEISGSRASSSGTTEVRCNSDCRLPEYSASASSALLRVVSVNRSDSSRLVTNTTATANRISAATTSRIAQGAR